MTYNTFHNGSINGLFSSLHHYFNPQLNRYVVPEGTYRSFWDFKKHLVNKFTHEFFKALADSEFISNSAYQVAFERFSHIPGAPWWVFPYFSAEEDWDEELDETVWTFWGPSEMIWPESYVSPVATNYDYLPLSDTTGIQELVKGFETNLMEFFDLHASKIVPTEQYADLQFPFALYDKYFLLDFWSGVTFSAFGSTGGMFERTPQVSWTTIVTNPDDYRVELFNDPYNPSSVPQVRTIMTTTNKEALYSVLPYSTDITTTIRDTAFLALEGEHDPVFYGVELEVSTDYSVKAVIDATEELFHICKSDGSITGSKPNKFEIVTLPASLKAHRRMWAEMLSNLDSAKFDTSNQTNNGMHVHIDRKAFRNARHLKRFTWFFGTKVNKPFIFAVSERQTMHEMDSWARTGDFEHNYEAKALKKSSRNLFSDKHNAINMNKPNTIEVRIFKGLVSYATVIKNLEFVDAVYNYTRDASLMEYTAEGFNKWLQATPKNKYSVLKLFLGRLDLDKLYFQSQVEALLNGLTDPEKICKALNSSSLAKTRKLAPVVAGLNKKFSKKLFAYDKDTNRILPTFINRAKLFDEDKNLAARYFTKKTA